jgi:nitrite reductase/ring-hydroxylating ferredoxin subunit
MQTLCALSDFQDPESKGFSVDDQAIVVVRKGQDCFAYINSCPHRGVPLEWIEHQFLDYEKTFIQCAVHGALFSIETGECIAGPCPGEELTAIPCIVDEGMVKVDLKRAT